MSNPTRRNPYTVLYNWIFWSIVGAGLLALYVFVEIVQRLG